MSFPQIEEEISSLLNLSLKELHRRGLEVLLTQELHQLEAELFRLLGRYGVQDVFEMETLYQEGKLAEAESWEDFFTIDHLTTRITELKAAREKLRRT